MPIRTIEDWKGMIRELCDYDPEITDRGRISDWEIGFIENIGKTLDNNTALTFRQESKVLEIWEKYLG